MSAIPAFYVYGLPEQPVGADFLHAETVMARGPLHGGRVAPHVHPQFHQLTFWVKGRGCYQLDGAQLDFAAPALVIMPQGMVHGFAVDPTLSDAITLSVSPVVAAELSDLAAVDLGRARLIQGGETADWALAGQLFAAVLAQTETGGGTARADQMALIRLELATALRLVAGASALGEGAGAAREEALFRRIRQEIESRYRLGAELSDYARAMGLTPYQLNRLCRRQGGATLMGLVARRRLLEAQRLLLFTDLAVELVGQQAGFDDSGYFSRFFQKNCGNSPGRWRLAHRATPLEG